MKPGTGLTVAVKTLNHDGLQGHKEWLVCIFITFPFLVLYNRAEIYRSNHDSCLNHHITGRGEFSW